MIKGNANQRFNLDDEHVPWWPLYPFGEFDLLATAPSGLKENIFVSQSDYICQQVSTHRTVLVRCYYHAAFLPGKHPNRCVVFSLSVIGGRRVVWMLSGQVSGQRRHHPW